LASYRIVDDRNRIVRVGNFRKEVLCGEATYAEVDGVPPPRVGEAPTSASAVWYIEL
jgi:hypothetical protein